MSRDGWIVLAVVGGFAYFFLFRKTAVAQVSSVPAPVGSNPTSGSSQVAPQDTFNAILNMIKETAGTVTDIISNANAQTSAQRN